MARQSPRTPRRTRRQSQVSKRQLTPESNDAVQFDGGPVKDVDGSSFSNASPSTAATEFSVSPEQKKRKHEHIESDSEYEAYYILKGHPCLRDPTEIPVIVKNDKGARKTLWTKMDTGADINTITESVLTKLGRLSEIEPITLANDVEIRDIAGQSLELDRKIKLSFWAGHHNQLCEDVEFWVPRINHDTDSDGVPDVLLGWQELVKHHMVMIDPDYHNEPDKRLEVVAKRSEDENPDVVTKAICLGKKYPQVKTGSR